jgi:hypothetical protein
MICQSFDSIESRPYWDIDYPLKVGNYSLLALRHFNIRRLNQISALTKK